MSTKQKKSPLARGHNPHRVTAAQVGRGWRLLTAPEIAARNSRYAPSSFDIQAWNARSVLWIGAYPFDGDDKNLTYRTRKPARYWLTH